MKEEHYVSLEMARALNQTGVFEYPAFLSDPYGGGQACWIKWKESEWELVPPDDVREDDMFWEQVEEGKEYTIIIPAPSLMELIDKLPNGYYIQILEDIDGKRCFSCSDLMEELVLFDTDNAVTAKTAPDAAAKMLLKIPKGKGE